MLRTEEVVEELVIWCGFNSETAAKMVTNHIHLIRRYRSVIRCCNRIVRLDRKERQIPPDQDYPEEYLK